MIWVGLSQIYPLQSISETVVTPEQPTRKRRRDKMLSIRTDDNHTRNYDNHTRNDSN